MDVGLGNIAKTVSTSFFRHISQYILPQSHGYRFSY